jgi:hypothetical protein
MGNKNVFSTREELATIAKILSNYARLPFSSINIPGAVMEGVLGHVRKAEVLRTYDFVDVIDRISGIGWQVKSTLAGTPVTWKRAKIPDRLALVAESERSAKGLAELGDAIIRFCNHHAQESMKTYDLKQIGYARLVIFPDGHVRYFERLLCTRKSSLVFKPEEFTWKWSVPKVTHKKEQLPALHGTHISTGKKWWAWHGKGENQLHFSGEGAWWPATKEGHSISFTLPGEAQRLAIEAFIDLISGEGKPLPSVKPA